MVTPITLQMICTLYPHLGPHAGFRQVRTRFDPARLRCQEQLVIKDGGTRPWHFRAARRLTRRWFSAPPQQYLLEDWLAERHCLHVCSASAVDVVHYLDAEHSLRHLPRWLHHRQRRPILTGLLHLPAEFSAPLLTVDAVRRLDAVLAVGGEQAEWLRSWLPSSRVHLVRHGIDVDFFHPAEGGPPDGPPWRLLTVGGHLRDHALFQAVTEALRGVPDLECHAVFRPPPGMKLPPNVRVHTGITDDELAALYRRCHVSFLPFAHLTASNALLEAMASGLPVVMPDLAAARTYADARQVRFFPVGDVEAAVHQIRELLADPAARLALGAAGRAAALQCTWQHSADAMMTLYESLVAAR